MCAEKNNSRNKRTHSWGCCDGTFEAIRGCFPDDAGYSACLARMNGNRRKFCGQKADDEAKGENQACCG